MLYTFLQLTYRHRHSFQQIFYDKHTDIQAIKILENAQTVSIYGISPIRLKSSLLKD